MATLQNLASAQLSTSGTDKVRVAYAAEQQQFHLDVIFEQGMTIWDAIEKSGLAKLTTLPEPLNVGIFGIKVADVHQSLAAGDRVEIYRPLTINPKDIRRKRAKANPSSKYCRSNRFKQLN